jgi:DNA repair exonuclease SbcCD ATPase subunit
MNLILDKIRFRNILSYGNNWTEVNLNNNKINLISATNAQGKSTIIDALYFALAGKPYRNINKPQLVNSINKKNLLVELYGHTKNNTYMIRRGINPAIFEIYKNDELIDESSNIRDYQTILEDLLGFKGKIIKHTLIMSSRFYVPFLELPLGEKREFIENILAITIFSSMKDLLKKEKISLKQLKINSEKDIERINSNIAILEDINKKQKEELEEQKKNLLAEIEKLEEVNVNIKVNIEKTKETIKGKKEFLVKIDEKLEIKKKVDKRINQLKFRINDVTKAIDFFKEKDLCLECEQPLTKEFKESKVEDKKKLYVALQNKLDEITEKCKKFEEIIIKKNKIEKENFDLYKEISGSESRIITNAERVEELKEKVNSIKKPEYKEYDKEKYEKEKIEIERKLVKLKRNRRLINIVLKILSESGIKKYIVNRYIPLLNKCLNDYLAILDAPYKMKFDNELKEKILARGYDKLSYGNFSAGEKQRIDLSLLFTFLNLSKMKNSINTNLLFLDEILDQSLDEHGINNVFKILKELKKAGYTIFVISHRQGIEEFFDKIFTVEKKRFSELKDDKGENNE